MHRPEPGEDFVARVEAHGKRAREATEQRREGAKVVRRELDATVEDLKRQVAVVNREAEKRGEIPKKGVVSYEEEFERLRKVMEVQKSLDEKEKQVERFEALAMHVLETDSHVDALKQSMETIRPFLQKTFGDLEKGGEEERKKEEEDRPSCPAPPAGREEEEEGTVRPRYPDEFPEHYDAHFKVFRFSDSTKLFFLCMELFQTALGQQNYRKNLQKVDEQHKRRIRLGQEMWAVDETGVQEMLDRTRVSPRKKLELVLHLNRNYSVSFTARKKGGKECKM